MLLFFISIIYCAQAINELSEGNILTIKKLIKESELKLNFFEEGHKGVIYFYKAKNIFPHLNEEDIKKLHTINNPTVDRTRSIENGVAKLRELSNELLRFSSINLVGENVSFIRSNIDNACKVFYSVAIKEKEDFDSFSELLKVDFNRSENIERFDELCKVFNRICFNRKKYVDIHQKISNQINEIVNYFIGIAKTNFFTLEMFSIQRNSTDFSKIICDSMFNEEAKIEEMIIKLPAESSEQNRMEDMYKVIIFQKIILQLKQIYKNLEIPTEQSEVLQKTESSELYDSINETNEYILKNFPQYIESVDILFKQLSSDCEKVKSFHEVLNEEYQNMVIIKAYQLDNLLVEYKKSFETLRFELFNPKPNPEAFYLAVQNSHLLLYKTRNSYYTLKFDTWLAQTLKTTITRYLEIEFKKHAQTMYNSGAEQCKKFKDFFDVEDESNQRIEGYLGIKYGIVFRSGEISDFDTWDGFKRLELMVKIGKERILKQRY